MKKVLVYYGWEECSNKIILKMKGDRSKLVKKKVNVGML